MTSVPKRFVGLHAHSTLSQGDGLGLPSEHIDYVIRNGGDALALTDHGHMNGFSHQWFHAKKKPGFKPIFGVEAYFVEDLAAWKTAYEDDRTRKAAEKARVDLQKKVKGKKKELVGDPAAGTQLDLLVTYPDAEPVPSSEEEVEVVPASTEAVLVEDEGESKAGRWSNPLMKRSHLVLLAKNSQGLRDLFALVSESYINGFYRYPRVDYRLLQKYAKGNIIGLQACVAGFLAGKVFDLQEERDFSKWEPSDFRFEETQAVLKTELERFQEALGPENYYLELQFNKLGAQHLVNQHFMELARRTRTPLVVTVDSHYSHPDHWREREIYRLMARQQVFKQEVSQDDLPKTVDDLKCELYPKNVEQVWESYQRYSQPYPGLYDDQVVKDAIERSWDIAHTQIGEVGFDTKVKLPKITSCVEPNLLEETQSALGPEATEDEVSFKVLVKVAIQGLTTRGLGRDPAYVSRLRHELEVIKHLKIAPYFLTYQKIMELLQKEMLTGAGRGSAAGSLLCYCLGITQVDPIKYGLLFERFLVRNKQGMPDIDSDASDREAALKLITGHFGAENVVSVSNFNNLQLRSLIKDLGRLSGMEFMEVNAVTSKVEAEARAEAKKQPGFDASQWVLTFEEAESSSPSFQEFMEKHPDLATTIKVLFKQQRSLSRHAGGVIITDNAYANMPVIRSKDVIQTPWTEGLNNRHLEPLGFLKFDILGLGTLRMFESCIKKILKKEGNKSPTFEDVKGWWSSRLAPEVNNYDDPLVYKTVYWEKRFCGVFQFVKDNVQTFISQMQPRSIIDLAVCTSIFRPGPLGLKADQLFLQNKEDPDSVRYEHPIMKEVLGETGGLMVFQEQLQLLVHKMAGWDLEDTDPIRKNFTKKEIAGKEKQLKEREELKRRFVEGCEKTLGLLPEQSERVWEMFAAWTAYGFNRAHAVSYAICSYICAWFLTYYPDEWVSAYVDYSSTEKGRGVGGEDPKAVALQEARRLGYTVGRADLNDSDVEVYVKPGTKTLVPSFLSMRYVGKGVYQELNRFRPYGTVEDLLLDPRTQQWRHSKFNKRALSTLVKLEALGSMNLVGTGKLFQNYRQLHHVVVDHAEEIKRASSRKRPPTAREVIESLTQEAQSLPDWTTKEKIEFQKTLQGSVDLALVVPPQAMTLFDENNVQSLECWTDEEDQYWAIVKGSSVAMTKHGKPYLKIKVTTIEETSYTVFVWSYDPKRDLPPPQENDLLMGKFKRSEMGFSSFPRWLHAIKPKP